MTLILGPFVKFICGSCGRKIERQISARRASQEIEELRDGPKLYCAFCERFPSDQQREDWRAARKVVT